MEQGSSALFASIPVNCLIYLKCDPVLFKDLARAFPPIKLDFEIARAPLGFFDEMRVFLPPARPLS